ncbi:MAG: MFS transporter [Eubacteriales bacterium]|nr:MFS transporter [Eubacteriales bacterium]
MERWKKNLYLMWVMQVLTQAGFSFGIPFISYFIQEIGITEPNKIKLFTALLSAAPAVTMAIMAPIWGILSDRFGKKKMLVRAALAGVILVGLMGFASDVSQLFILRILQGVFTGSSTAALIFIASNTPDKDLPGALGVLTSAIFIGTTIGPALGGISAESFGYRTSFFIGAGILAVTFFMTIFLIKEDPVSETRGKRMKPITGINLKSLLNYSLVMLLLILFFSYMARTVFGPYISLFVQQIRGKLEGSSAVTGLINAFAALMVAFSGLLTGKLMRRFKKYRLLLLLLLMAVIVSAVLFMSKGIAMFAIMYGMLAFSLGSIEPLVMSITSQTVEPDKRGSLIGIETAVSSLGWCLAPIIAGIVSIEFSIHSVQLLIIAFVICAIVLTVIAERHEKKLNA